MLVTSGGIAANTYRYKPFGESNGGTGTTYNRFHFTGTYLDSVTSLYQMGARYYQPASGRFTCYYSRLRPHGHGRWICGTFTDN